MRLFDQSFSPSLSFSLSLSLSRELVTLKLDATIKNGEEVLGNSRTSDILQHQGQTDSKV